MSHQQQHIAFVVNNYPPKVGGLEQHVYQLAHHVARLGHRVTVVALDNSNVGVETGQITVLRLQASGTVAGVMSAPFLGTTKRLRVLLRDEGVTLVSVHTRFFPMSLIGLRAGLSLGIPVIHTEHGSDHVKGVSPLVGLASRLVDLTMGRYILKRSTSVLAISAGAKDFVWRLAKRQSNVFHNAIETQAFKTSQGSVLRQRLVFLGRLVPGKGWDHTLDVAAALKDDYPDLEVHFIGDGVERAKLLHRLESSQIAGKAVFHGYLDATQIRDVLSNSILLNPTVLAEGFQTTLLEAIASGAAVVSTPVAAAKYLASEGAAVSIVEEYDIHRWADEVRGLLEDGWSAASPNLVDRFDWKNRAEEFITIAEGLEA